LSTEIIRLVLCFLQSTIDHGDISTYSLVVVAIVVLFCVLWFFHYLITYRPTLVITMKTIKTTLVQ